MAGKKLTAIYFNDPAIPDTELTKGKPLAVYQNGW